MLALSAIAVTAVSCSDDDKPTPAEQNQLLGKWSYMEELALDVNGNVVSTYSDDNGECPYDTLNLKTMVFYRILITILVTMQASVRIMPQMEYRMLPEIHLSWH